MGYFTHYQFAPVRTAVAEAVHLYLPEKCGEVKVENNTPKIIKGYEAKPGEFPWQVKLVIYINSKFLHEIKSQWLRI